MGVGIYKHYSGTISPHYKHGLTGTRLYRIWSNMKNRCTNPKSNRYAYYLGKGITVCEEWDNSFQAFYNWAMSNGYSDTLTLDRIDGDKGYGPDNCRWVDYHTQNINKKCSPVYEYQGVKFRQCDVYKLFGIKRTTFQARLKRGWSVEDAVGSVNNG